MSVGHFWFCLSSLKGQHLAGKFLSLENLRWRHSHFWWWLTFKLCFLWFLCLSVCLFVIMGVFRQHYETVKVEAKDFLELCKSLMLHSHNEKKSQKASPTFREWVNKSIFWAYHWLYSACILRKDS